MTRRTRRCTTCWARTAIENPFRSAAPNTKNAKTGDLPRPFGDGAEELGYPGFFAANMSFDSTGEVHAGVYTRGEIRAPDRMMYLVDSYAGETIGNNGDFNVAFDWKGKTCEVDFRYSGDTCLMLFLDGHTDQQGFWTNLEQLQENRRIKVTDVTTN
jgi:hypothetical protein